MVAVAVAEAVVDREREALAVAVRVELAVAVRVALPVADGVVTRAGHVGGRAPTTQPFLAALKPRLHRPH